MKRTIHFKNHHRAFIQPVLTRNVKHSTCFSDFYFGSSCSTLEELQVWVSSLGAINQERKDNVGKHIKVQEIPTQLGLYAWGKPAEYIFMLSEYWGLQDEAKYIALELFNVFMSALVMQLRKLIFDKIAFSNYQSDSSFDTSSEIDHHSQQFAPGDVFSSKDKNTHLDWMNLGRKKANSEWKKTLEHIKSQMKLRAVTCVVIASKATAHYEIVTLNKALDFLQKQGHHFSKSVLLKSELRILKAINFRIKFLPSPHPYITVMLEILNRTDQSFNVKLFYPICIRILDLFYYLRPRIIGRVSEILVTELGLPNMKSLSEAQRFIENQNDLQFISAGIIAASVYIKNKSISDNIITLLSKMIHVQESDLTRFTCIILDVTLAS
uniref:cyclin N-terminal domain-containing protein 1-like n=1 Tax=Styela clava TaxID=7725 RepID=UPI001939D1C7|nr:cyclin N-terminal domain-containing protein 1-like [Styela clava]